MKEDKEIDYMIEYIHFFNFAIICQYEQHFSYIQCENYKFKYIPEKLQNKI